MANDADPGTIIDQEPKGGKEVGENVTEIKVPHKEQHGGHGQQHGPDGSPAAAGIVLLVVVIPAAALGGGVLVLIPPQPGQPLSVRR